MLFFVMHTKLDQAGLSWFELTTANQVGADGLKLMLMKDIELWHWKVLWLLRNLENLWNSDSFFVFQGTRKWCMHWNGLHTHNKNY